MARHNNVKNDQQDCYTFNFTDLIKTENIISFILLSFLIIQLELTQDFCAQSTL